jgi:hypothetical protein
MKHLFGILTLFHLVLSHLTITTDLTGGVLQVLEDDCNTLLNGVTGACTATLTH